MGKEIKKKEKEYLIKLIFLIMFTSKSKGQMNQELFKKECQEI